MNAGISRQSRRGGVPAGYLSPYRPRNAQFDGFVVWDEGFSLGHDSFRDPLSLRFVDLTQSRDRKRDVLADHLPVLRWRSRDEFDAHVPLRDLAQSRGLVQGTDISMRSASEHTRPVRVTRRQRYLGRNGLHDDRRPRVLPVVSAPGPVPSPAEA